MSHRVSSGFQRVARAAGLALLAASAWGLPAGAVERTAVALTGGPFHAEYSQALALQARLTDETGTTPFAGDTCRGGGVDQPCRITFTLTRTDAADDVIVLGDAPTDADGFASLRLTFVDGRYGDSAFVAAPAPDGTAYVLSARFLGKGISPGSARCDPENAEEVDGDYCPSAQTGDVTLFQEVPDVVLSPGLSAPLGGEVLLSARLTDDNGDAAPGGTDLDGAGEKTLAAMNIQFFYDANDDGRPAAGTELIGEAITNAAGVASLPFTLDPQYVTGGTHETGIIAYYGGDTHYALAYASTALTIGAGALDVAQTLLEADPDTLAADGAATSTIRVRLVDEFGNLFDENAEPHNVRLTANLGMLIDDVLQDPLNGTYTQTFRATRKDGVAHVQVFVDDVAGPTLDLQILGGGCTCAATCHTQPLHAPRAALATLAGMLWVAGRRRPRGRAHVCAGGSQVDGRTSAAQARPVRERDVS